MIKFELEKKIKQALSTKSDIVLHYSSRPESDFSLTPRDVAILKQELEVTDLDLSLLSFEGVEVSQKGGFINFKILDYSEEIKDLFDNDEYLVDERLKNKTVLIDYSSPNIAKKFSIGNLRSTIIGDAVYRTYRAIGANAIGINHVGDWGTQFGKLIVAIEKWGDDSEIAKNPIDELNKLYVKFHVEAEQNPKLDDEARAVFKKLETGDEQVKKVWKKCVDWSLEEFARNYRDLGVEIDEIKGESFYLDLTGEVVDILKQKNLLKQSEGASIVELEKLPPVIIIKSDEATIYATRDLAAIKYRVETYNPFRIVYHVGLDQQLHFAQVFEVARLAGLVDDTELVFAGHGMVKLPEGKMSTRAGNVVLIDELINEGTKKISQVFVDKSKESLGGEKARALAVDAIKYSDIKQNRKTNVTFKWEDAFDLNGNSAPYLMYSYARICSIINKSKTSLQHVLANIEKYSSPENLKIVFGLQPAVYDSANLASPNYLCSYLFSLAEQANSYYERVRVLSDDAEEEIKNITPLFIYKKLFEISFDLLGLSAIDEL